jgi:hypothetical protein
MICNFFVYVKKRGGRDGYSVTITVPITPQHHHEHFVNDDAGLMEGYIYINRLVFMHIVLETSSEQCQQC